jgi:hypothetical protein
MDINNVTQFRQLLVRCGLVDRVARGNELVTCLNEYSYNCNCEKQTNRGAIYHRCNAIYEEMVMRLDKAAISLLFQNVSDLQITFRKDIVQHIRTIVR